MRRCRETGFCVVLMLYLVVCLVLLLHLQPPLNYLASPIKVVTAGLRVQVPDSRPSGVRATESLLLRGQLQNNTQIRNDTRHSNLSTSTLSAIQLRETANVLQKNTDRPKVKKPSKKGNDKLGIDYNIWNYTRTQYCSGMVTSYGDIFFSWHDLFINRTLATAKMVGGEDPMKLLGVSKDEDEEYTYEQGIFLQTCPPDGKIGKTFHMNKNSAHYTLWMPKVSYTANATLLERLADLTHGKDHIKARVQNRLTIAMMRYEFANVFWVLQDIYNAFLTAKYFNQSLSECDVVLFDAHPATQLDPLYFNTTHHTRLLSGTAELTQYNHLVWPLTRIYSPLLNPDKTTVPLYLAEFRSYLLQRFGVLDNHTTPCGMDRKFNVLFPWRHDYIAHPRNPTGKVTRKVANEEEIISALTNSSNSISQKIKVRGVQLDSLTMYQQLHLITHTDIMIGMHGAAFAFITFLPTHAGVVELYPKGSSQNWHMGNLAKWKGHFYKAYMSTVPQDSNRATKLSTKLVISLIEEAMTKMCAAKPG